MSLLCVVVNENSKSVCDKSEKLKCKFDRMTNSGKTMMESMEAFPDLLTPAQSHGMGKAKERMDREKNDGRGHLPG